MSAHFLPDSRLKSPWGTVMMDWAMPDGTTVRIEAEPVYCINCGKPYGYVPKENTIFTCWMCMTCYEKYGAIANTYVEPDDVFNRKVEAEMLDRFGHGLTVAEICFHLESGTLGTGLEKLMRESPYPSDDNRPKR